MIDENRFWELVRNWEYQTKFYSDSSRILSHPSLNEIILMGHEAIPLILRALKDNWFLSFALHKITGEWPVKKEYAGNGVKITECWLDWAQKRGYKT